MNNSFEYFIMALLAVNLIMGFINFDSLDRSKKTKPKKSKSTK